MGRLVLNVLLSFAQFEREIISERTRDKIAATRRKGKWCGGIPVLGYDVDPQVLRLAVNPKEATRVRAIFDLYLEHQALLPVVRELERRGWRTKAWVTRKGRKIGGQPFTKTSLHRLLTNAIYAGKLRYKKELHNGEHAAIVDPAKWRKVQELLQCNRSQGFKRAPGVGCDPQGLIALPAVRLRHDPDLREPGQQALSLLHLLQCSKARLGPLPLPVCSGRSHGVDRAGADDKGGPGPGAPQENS
jgi:hypothetical protein